MFTLLLLFQQLLCAGHKISSKWLIVPLAHCRLGWKRTSGPQRKPLCIVWRSYQRWQDCPHHPGQSQPHPFTFCRLLGNQFESSVKHNEEFIVVWHSPSLHIWTGLCWQRNTYPVSIIHAQHKGTCQCSYPARNGINWERGTWNNWRNTKGGHFSGKWEVQTQW